MLDPAASQGGRRGAIAGLGLTAVVGPWLSFPAAFLLGSASLALAVHVGRGGSLRAWLAWGAFNAAVAVSAATLWYFSGRHMYYSGMIEHWGHRGWNGFPDWSSPLGIVKWLISRPIDLGNYGTRELGVVLFPIAIVGVVRATRRSHALAVVLVAPFALTVTAALLGKYPLAHRTGFFLLPCLWLLVALGIAQLVDWAARRNWNLASLAPALLAMDAGWMLFRCAVPDAWLDYRGAYEFVREHREPDDLVWSEMAIVHETYYGKPSYLVDEDDVAAAERLVGAKRIWVVWGDGRDDWRRRLQMAGGRVAFRHHVSRMDVILFEPDPGRLTQLAENPR